MSEPAWDDAATAALDRSLTDLFAADRPGPDLEARVIARLRSADAVPARPPSRWRRGLAAGAAATAALGATAAGVAAVVNAGGVPFPGQVFAEPVALTDRLHGVVQNEATVADLGVESALPAGIDDNRLEAPKLQTRSALQPPSAGAGRGFGGGGFGGGGFGGGGFGGVPPAVPPGTATMNSYMGYMWWDKDSGEPSVYTARNPTGGPTAPGPDLARRPIKAYDINRFSDHAYFTPAFATEEPGRPRSRVSERGLGEVREQAAEGKLDQLRQEQEVRAKQQEGREADRFAGRPVTGKPGQAGQEDFMLRGLNGVEIPDPVVGVRVVTQQPADLAPPAAGRKVVIRSGDIEFEIDSFDSAVAAVTQLVLAIPNAYVATVNSEKLANGKVKGSVAVRVPPDKLDGLVLDLRKELGKAGELKGQRIGSQDITKQYTDLESRLKAARTMETRLLEIIKTGKGEIKQLLEAEKELGVWRTKIEEIEGELRYFGNLASLSSLTIVLAEKEIRAAAGLTESERVQAGVEVEEVEQAFRELLKAVLDAKGRVSKSELKQHAGGQFAASLHFETPPDAAGPVRDRLRQLGRVARFEIDKVQNSSGTPTKDTKVTRGDTLFQVQLYNLANVAPRETATVQLAAVDVPAAYRTVREAVERAKGRVLSAQLTEGEPKAVTATLDVEVKRADEPAVQAALAAAGDVLSRAVSRAAETDATTDSKVRVTATIGSAARLKPRETTSLGLEVENVDTAATALAAAVQEANGRVVEAGINKEASGRVSGRFVYEVPLSAAGGLLDKAKAAGTVRVQQTARDPNAPDGRLAVARVEVTAATGELIVARDDGVWPQVRKGLSLSATALLASLSWLIVAVCVALPWALLLWAGYRLVRRRRAS